MAIKKTSSSTSDSKATTKEKASLQTKQEFLFPSLETPPKAPIKKSPRQKVISRIVIHFDAGFGNTLFVRGSCSELSWEKGVPLTNIKSDEWTWESDAPFHEMEFKILINDNHYESGENHRLICGDRATIVPQF